MIGRIVLTLLLCVTPTLALEHVYIVRHAEKKADWPEGRAINPYTPLNEQGIERAEALAEELKNAGIVAVYGSPTTRSLHTGFPIARDLNVKLEVSPESVNPAKWGAWLDMLKERHADDRAILIVGHSNTVPAFLAHLGATKDEYPALGIEITDRGLRIQGNHGLWTVSFGKEFKIERREFGGPPDLSEEQR